MENEKVRMKKLAIVLFFLPLSVVAKIETMYLPGEIDFSYEACARCSLKLDGCDFKTFSKEIKRRKPMLTPGNSKFDAQAYADWLICKRRINSIINDQTTSELLLKERMIDAKIKELKELQKKQQEHDGIIKKNGVKKLAEPT